MVGVVVGALGGALFCAIHGDTTYHRAIAYGWWIVAALLLVLMPVAGSKWLYRRTNTTLPEGPSFVGAALALCVAGVVLDVAGT